MPTWNLLQATQKGKRRSLQPRTNHPAHPAVASVDHAVEPALDGNVSQTSTHKKRARGASEPRVLDPSTHPWTPAHLDHSVFTLEPEVVKPRRGNPGIVWTEQQTKELIRLVIKTDVCFDDIPAALSDKNGENGPS